jgi:hypothetical protein
MACKNPKAKASNAFIFPLIEDSEKKKTARRLNKATL